MNKRFTAHAGLVLALVLGLVASFGSTATVQAEPTANPDDEIVYIDSAGYIRVVDPNVAAGTQAIEWVSPEGGWYDFATGDFNNDGDQEIVAIGNGKLTVFDPVVRSAAITPDGYKNLVPWAILDEFPVPGAAPNIVGAGNMDINVPGDEIIYGYNIDESATIKYRLMVIKTDNGQGTSWATHEDQPYAAPWKFVDVGNVNNIGSDDIVLLRDADSLFDVREVDNRFNRIFARADSSAFTPVNAAIGQVYAGGTGEVVMLRDYPGTTESPVLLIYQFKDGTWKIDEHQNDPNDDSLNFFPHPKNIFLADVNGNDDDEIFWLRNAPSGSGVARLYMLNRGGDQLPGFSSSLDEDSGYSVGAGGDVDADGKDEVVVMRNNRIRNYYAVETGNNTLYTDYTRYAGVDITTNNRSLHLANLDGNGFTAGARFNASPASVEITLQAGTVDRGNVGVTLTNIGSGGSIDFTAAKETGVTWFSFSAGGTSTPASLFLTNFDATDLAPGEYKERIRITAPNTDVLNEPFYIPVILTVTPANFLIRPGAVSAVFLDGDTQAQDIGVEVTGLPGLNYTAGILDRPTVEAATQALGGMPKFGYTNDSGELVLSNSYGDTFTTDLMARSQGEVSAAVREWPSGVPWASASSVGTEVPDTITVTISPTLMTDIASEALLVVVTDERAGEYPENIAVTQIAALKANEQVYLPYGQR